jgi:hypothetical protein
MDDSRPRQPSSFRPRQVGLGKVSGAGRPGTKAVRQAGLGEVSGAGRPRKAVLGRLGWERCPGTKAGAGWTGLSWPGGLRKLS